MSFLLIFIRKRLRFIYQLFIFKSMYINTLKNRNNNKEQTFQATKFIKKVFHSPLCFMPNPLNLKLPSPVNEIHNKRTVYYIMLTNNLL